MKKIIFFTIALFAIALSFSSCDFTMYDDLYGYQYYGYNYQYYPNYYYRYRPVIPRERVIIIPNGRHFPDNHMIYRGRR